MGIAETLLLVWLEMEGARALPGSMAARAEAHLLVRDPAGDVAAYVLITAVADLDVLPERAERWRACGWQPWVVWIADPMPSATEMDALLAVADETGAGVALAWDSAVLRVRAPAAAEA